VKLERTTGARTARTAVALSAILASSMVLTACAGAPSPLAAYSDTILLQAPTPEIAAMSPVTGSLSGGDIVTITGVSLDTVTAVTFGSEPATDVTVVSATELAVVVPRAADYQASTARVEVLTDGEPVSTASDLTFQWSAVTPVDKQLEYAFQHWDRPNYNLASFGTFNPVGGDCVNFVSQTLLARGWDMTDGWYNRDAGKKWTAAWVHVPSFDNWLRANQDALGVKELTIEQRDQVKVGDILMFDWNHNNSLDHTQIVSDVQVVNGETIIKMAGHNTDSNWRDLDKTISVDHPGGAVYFWSVN
jgi:hypothetical protein